MAVLVARLPWLRPQPLALRCLFSSAMESDGNVIEVVGLVRDPDFHVAKNIAEGLFLVSPQSFSKPKIQPLLEFEWNIYLSNKKMSLGGEVWQYSSNMMCFVNGVFFGNEMDLSSWARTQWNFSLPAPTKVTDMDAEKFYIEHLLDTGHKFVYMDIEIGAQDAGRLLFELFTDVCPKTSKNFEALCTGEMEQSESGLELCYRGTLFHRIVPNGWVQGGDISPGSKGNGGESIYGPVFEDECFAISHSKRGILGMANQGTHTNASQFYVTLQPTAWMDETYVAFGQVAEGFDVLKKLEETPTNNERPTIDCKVAECGLLDI